jgi:hypothetical protein
MYTVLGMDKLRIRQLDQIARSPKQLGAIIQRQRRQLALTQNGLGA